ncbi:hypothetical protein F2Q69_00017252 [Brassica cretica]|uniref:Uncharacterized protein n=1 Tax=Brassica cretica TaxID=69181 RepID=A0A8S9QMJ7_BRACR|nr:hypothetical protein F2Q69_00017252 [Brassica cretica]
MDSAQPPDLSGTAPATSKVQEGSGHGFAGPENGLTRKEGFPHKALSWAGIAQEKKLKAKDINILKRVSWLGLDHEKAERRFKQ